MTQLTWEEAPCLWQQSWGETPRFSGTAQGSRAITRALFLIPRCISPLSVTAANHPPGPGEDHSAGAGVVQGEECRRRSHSASAICGSLSQGGGRAASGRGMAASCIECHPEPFQMKGRPSFGCHGPGSALFYVGTEGRKPPLAQSDGCSFPQLREDLQTAFPCAGLSLAWRGKRRT